jgi:hypothetical protein
MEIDPRPGAAKRRCGKKMVRQKEGAGNNGLCGKREWNDLGIFVVFYAFLLNGSRIPVVP